MRIYGATTENGLSNEYLVMIKSNWDDSVCFSIMTPMEIIDREDMTDCTNEELKVYALSWDKDPQPLKIWGAWHDPSDPLYIKVTDSEGNLVFDGYGTDH